MRSLNLYFSAVSDQRIKPARPILLSSEIEKKLTDCFLLGIAIAAVLQDTSAAGVFSEGETAEALFRYTVR